MSVHPVLEALQIAVPQFVVCSNGLQGILWGAGDLRHANYTHRLTFEEMEGYAVELESSVTLRYPITARNELYVRALGKEFEEHLDVTEVFIMRPNGIGFTVEFDDEYFERFADLEDVTNELWGQISGATSVLAAICRIGNLNYRLQNRGGTEQYKRLMPSLLAKLTVCGHDRPPS